MIKSGLDLFNRCASITGYLKGCRNAMGCTDRLVVVIPQKVKSTRLRGITKGEIIFTTKPTYNSLIDGFWSYKPEPRAAQRFSL